MPTYDPNFLLISFIHTLYIHIDDHFSCQVSDMVVLDNDGFLLALTKMFQNNRSSGSVSILTKKYDGRTTRATPASPDNLCIIRAGDNKTKIATIISSKEVTKFQMSYATLLRGNMDSLKKHDKSKERKERKRKDL